MAETLWIPEGTMEIAPRAFMGNDKLEIVYAPKTLRIIYPQAFERCARLTLFVVEWGGVLERVGDWAFAHDHELQKVIFPGSVRDMNLRAFEDCPKLQSVIVGQRFEVWINV